jgi:carboxypeptidase Taq
VHWSGGSIGYFSTYALGNLISLQIWQKVIADLPSLTDGFEQGEFGPLRDWLREHVHRYGRKFTPAETLERIVGTKEIDPEPYVSYLRNKLVGLYGISATA